MNEEAWAWETTIIFSGKTTSRQAIGKWLFGGVASMGKFLADYWTRRKIPVAFYVDGDSGKQGKIFQEGIIQDPAVLDGISDQILVFVSPQDNRAICDKLVDFGYVENVSFIREWKKFGRLLERRRVKAVVDALDEARERFGCDVIVCFAARSAYVRSPSKVETALPHHTDLVSEKYSWLRANPPHVAAAHRNLSYYSDEYIEEIFTGSAPILVDGVFSQSEHRSRYVNVTNGNLIRQKT